MKTIVTLLAAAGLALAQNLSGQPDCATACLISAISAAGCGASDLGCQCGPTQSFIAASAAPCLLASCTGTQLLQAQSAGAAQCSSYSATVASQSATTTPASSEQSSSAATRDDVVSSTTGTPTTPVESSGSETSAPTPLSTSASADLAESTGSTDSSSSTSTGAAAAMATPAMMGAGALLGVLGVAAAL